MKPLALTIGVTYLYEEEEVGAPKKKKKRPYHKYIEPGF